MARLKCEQAVQIRRVRKADLARLQELYDQLHLNTYLSLRVPRAKLAAAFERLARDRNHAILIAEVAGKIVGTCHVIIVPHLGHALKPMAIAENVVVDASARSMGIGEKLMEAAGDVARRRGCYKMALTSNVARPRAHKFYERLGWKRTHFGYSLGLE
ncbi:MAG TPA: GNAT family N-acetyltransferase [Candidatus Binataceae bacterium]|nr:GNAT family N-acetyltransferase [Candidatus Binataceae bacterium]